MTYIEYVTNEAVLEWVDQEERSRKSEKLQTKIRWSHIAYVIFLKKDIG